MQKKKLWLTAALVLLPIPARALWQHIRGKPKPVERKSYNYGDNC